ncbi:hypothetical protein H310_05736 [Aphanomyces invadans]|uniref:Ubiquitin-like 1-activating enzyme E1A n=1 Tax=Aphanomyces invadans TaxID=157072 RepID=A0A024U8E3_9STRA|nr:hypothetical protein H310_05736 [Aphanomyces invadans]ETW02167.1 hypothetical protein H310_05736 [Aphanomyces invadans]|eukprot:XP_008868772.1 hypothetical protein H310_05736 [Aphanomyces invadans]
MGKHEEQDAELTAQEAAVYDRQMRLWGVEAQKRLQNSHILISGMTQLGSEVAKNLVLSGMSVTLHDVNVVTRANVDTQFFLTEDQIGLNRAEACLSAVQELNPLVHVSAITKPLDHYPSDHFDQYSVVCVLSASRKLQIYLDNLCREKNIAFYAGHAFGLSGIFFCDLGNEHVYRRHVQSTDAPSDTTTVPELKVSYPSLETSALATWSSLKPTRKRSPVTPAPYIAYQLLLEFVEAHHEFPTAATTAEFVALAKSQLEGQGLPGFFDDHQLATLAATAEADVVPVCAIVAGILGQEVIKAISMKDEPLNNYFFFDGATGEGTVRRIG